MKFAYLLLITLIGLASCRASLEQKVYKELPERPSESAVKLIRAQPQKVDTTSLVAYMKLNVDSHTGLNQDDIMKILKTQTQVLGGDAVQVYRSSVQSYLFGSNNSIQAGAYYLGLDEQEQSKILQNETKTSVKQVFSPKFELALDCGYTYDYNYTKGAPAENISYYKQLAGGLMTQLNANILFNRYMGLGLIYNGFTANGDLPENIKEIVSSHYIGLSWHFKGAISDRFLLKYDIGLGYYSFADHLKSDIARLLISTGTGLGLHLSFGCDYKLSKAFGLGINIGLMSASMSNPRKINSQGVMESIEGRVGVSRFNISGGIRYYIGEAKSNLKPIVTNK